MELFLEFFKQGFLHILDFQGLDHLLFLLVVGVVYNTSKWAQLVWVLTAFTIAHTITLSLALFEIVEIKTSIVEFLIPTTILFTCLENILFTKHHNGYRILFAGVFGLIHGMGFSTLLKELFNGMNYNPMQTLLPFNLGIEIAQIVIILIMLFVFQQFYKFRIILQPNMVKFISVLIGLQSIIWMVQRFPF